MNQKKPYRFYLLLLLVACCAFLPVLLFRHPLKWDLIDQAYPWRYFIGECLQEGILPLWNPYQLLGSPIHADPQSSAWYPVTWAIGYLFGYDIYTISVDFILHIFLAGLGMFYLSKQMRFSDEGAFFTAVAYMLSGFFIGNAQHFMWIISGTWIPFILGAFLALKENPGPEGAVRFALAFFMMVTGGYPAFIFLLIYLLVAVFILFTVQYLYRGEYRALLRFSGYSMAAAVLSVLMAAVVLIGVYHVQGAMTRSSGVTLGQALFCAFTPRSFISFILPFASIREMEFYHTDLSMSNAYFGIIALLFFLVSLMRKRPGLLNLFLAWGLFCLVAATGEATPVREFLFHYLPGMNQFRFPSLFRIYAILSFVLMAGYGFEILKDYYVGKQTGDIKAGKWLKVFTLAAGLIILGFMVFAMTRGNLKPGEFIKEDLFIFSQKSRINQHIFFQGLIQLIVLAFFFLLITRRKAKLAVAGILVLSCLDLILASRLNGPYTVYYPDFRSKEIHDHTRIFPEGFPVPGTEHIINNKDQGGLVFQALWRNLNIFHRQISYQGYNPLHLKGFEELADNHPKLFEAILDNPLAYHARRTSPADSILFHEQRDDYDPRRVYLNPVDYQPVMGSVKDSAAITFFSPVEIRIRSISQGKVILNLLQNNYHGWKATIDGIPAEIITANLSFIAVWVPAGEHEVIFRFNPQDVRWGFYLTLLLVIGGLVISGRTLQGL